jgi:hypothetical protein
MKTRLSRMIDWFVFGGGRFEGPRDGGQSLAAVSRSTDRATYAKGTNIFGR